MACGSPLDVGYFAFDDAKGDTVPTPVHDTSARVTLGEGNTDRKSTRLNSSHKPISYAVFCLKKKNTPPPPHPYITN